MEEKKKKKKVTRKRTHLSLKKKKKNTKTKKRASKSVNDVLNEIYYNYGEEGALNNNVETLTSLLRKRGVQKANRKDVLNFLSKQPGYTVHKRIKKLQFPRRTIRVATTGIRIDGDLIELGDLSQWNDNYKYIFTVIDSFSRYLWTVPLKTKESGGTAAALKLLIEENNVKALSLYTDAGKEFIGAPFQSVLKANGIKHRICASDDFHCPFVERVIRTIKEKLFQAMTSNYTRRWIDYLPDVTTTYNKTIHSATGQKPYLATRPENYLSVLKQLEKKHQMNRGKTWKFQKGDLVRIYLGKGGNLGRKGYLPRFGWEIFKIQKLANDRGLDGGSSAVPAYILEDLNGEVIEHALFYENELSLVHKEQLSREAPVKEILEEKGDMVKVWFQGFPKASAEWIPRKNLV